MLCKLCDQKLTPAEIKAEKVVCCHCAYVWPEQVQEFNKDLEMVVSDGYITAYESEDWNE